MLVFYSIVLILEAKDFVVVGETDSYVATGYNNSFKISYIKEDTIYVTYSAFDSIFVKFSENGGSSWERIVSLTSGLEDEPKPSCPGIDFPYVVWQEKSLNSTGRIVYVNVLSNAPPIVISPEAHHFAAHPSLIKEDEVKVHIVWEANFYRDGGWDIFYWNTQQKKVEMVSEHLANVKNTLPSISILEDTIYVLWQNYNGLCNTPWYTLMRRRGIKDTSWGKIDTLEKDANLPPHPSISYPWDKSGSFTYCLVKSNPKKGVYVKLTSTWEEQLYSFPENLVDSLVFPVVSREKRSKGSGFYWVARERVIAYCRYPAVDCKKRCGKGGEDSECAGRCGKNCDSILDQERKFYFPSASNRDLLCTMEENGKLKVIFFKDLVIKVEEERREKFLVDIFFSSLTERVVIEWRTLEKKGEKIEVQIYDAVGRIVNREVVVGEESGKLEWKPTSSGVYFVKIKTQTVSQSKKVIVLL